MKNLFILIFLIILTSCGNNLSRTEAQKIINDSEQFQKIGQNPKIHSNAIDEGIEQGYWTQNRNLTSKGYNYFNQLSYNSLSLKEPINCVVTSIDGIANSKNALSNNDDYKEVQFSWKFSNVNSIIKRFILKGGKGVAFLRKFDDGWRLDRISVDYSNTKFTLTEVDKKSIQQDIEAENSRRYEEQIRLAEEKARREAEKEKRELLIAESKKIHKTIGTYNGVHNFTGRKLDKKIVLTDVHVFRDLAGSENYLNVWFGSLTKKPTAYKFRQTAMAWNGFAVDIGGNSVHFKDKNEATRFYLDLLKAVENWNEKYPELKKW